MLLPAPIYLIKATEYWLYTANFLLHRNFRFRNLIDHVHANNRNTYTETTSPILTNYFKRGKLDRLYQFGHIVLYYRYN